MGTLAGHLEASGQTGQGSGSQENCNKQWLKLTFVELFMQSYTKDKNLHLDHQTYRKPVDLWIYPGADTLSGGQNVYIKAGHIWFRGCFCHGTNHSVDAGAVEVALLPVSICQAS